MKECKDNLFNQHVFEYTTKEEIYVCMTTKIAYDQVHCHKGKKKGCQSKLHPCWKFNSGHLSYYSLNCRPKE